MPRTGVHPAAEGVGLHVGCRVVSDLSLPVACCTVHELMLARHFRLGPSEQVRGAGRTGRQYWPYRPPCPSSRRRRQRTQTHPDAIRCCRPCWRGPGSGLPPPTRAAAPGHGAAVDVRAGAPARLCVLRCWRAATTVG